MKRAPIEQVKTYMTTTAKKPVNPSSDRASRPDRYYSRAIGNALRVLELFQQSSRPLALADVTHEVKLPKSSAFRILRTLEVAGYIQRVENERFVLARAAAAMANHQINQVVEAARPMMRHLSQEFRETISLAFLFENRIEVAAVIDSPHRVSMGNEAGGLIPPHASSLGKCISAFQEEGLREKLFRSFGLVRFTPNTIVEEMALTKELELVRAQGYARDLEETTLGGCCLGAPIFDRQDRAVAAISISMPKMRFANQDRAVAAVRDAAAAITQQLRGA